MAGDYHKYFLIEAGEILDRMTASIARLRHGAAEPQEVRALMRSAHTLKGAAQVVSETQAAELAHTLEDVLSPHTAANTLPDDVLHRTLGLIDSIASSITREIAPTESGPAVHLPTAAAEPAQVAEGATIRVDVAEIYDLVSTLGEASVGLGVLQDSVASLATATATAASVTRRLLTTTQQAQSFDGQTRRMVEQLALNLDRLERKISDETRAVVREITSASRIAEQIRLAPIERLEPSLRRAALTAAEALGKRVIFSMTGQSKRVDAELLSSLRDPLLHVVRNAVAHGIEAPDVRAKAGKPPTGRVQLSCSTRHGILIFTCEDDGQGIDVAALRAVLVDQGVLTLAEATAEPDSALMQRIFTPDVSTSTRADAVSGRGVGLDVVREAVERLHGSVAVVSTPARGTQIELRVPLNIVAAPVLECEAGERHFAVPAEVIKTVAQFSSTEVVHTDSGDMLEHRGLRLKLRDAAAMFGGRTSRRGRTHRTAVVVQAGTAAIALEVERIVGIKTVVQKPFPEFARISGFIAGGSVDVAGQPQLVVNVEGLDLAPQLGSARELASVPRKPVLVVDDSLTTRMLEQSILEAAAYNVHVVASAEEALQQLGHCDYGLLLVDVEMPGMNGFDLVDQVKKNPSFHDIPCILVTSRSSADDRQRGREVGADDYIVKGDFNQQYLLARIGELIKR